MAGNFFGVELFVISDKASGNTPGAGWKTRVVQWIKDGKSVSVKLECGEYWNDEKTGEPRFKSKGFALRDLEACKPHWLKIIDLMKNPPPVPTADPTDIAGNPTEEAAPW